MQQYQFALTHPEYAVYDDQGNFQGLKDEGAQLFQSFLNQSYYGDDGRQSFGGKPVSTKEQPNPVAPYHMGDDGSIWVRDPNTGELRGLSDANGYREYLDMFAGSDRQNNQNYEIYQRMLAQTTAPDMRIESTANNTLASVPFAGNIVKVGNRLMLITMGVRRSTEGRNHDEFKIMDLATGAERLFTGLSSGNDSINNMSNWANDLGTL